MKKQLQTPRWVDWIIENLAPPGLAEEIRGDLHELFLKDVTARGEAAAKTRYVLNAAGFLARGFFWKRNGPKYSSMMAGSYLKMATRSLSAHKSTAIINVVGLVIGIASALVILTVIRFELGFDKFHSDVSRIYRVVRVGGNDMSDFRTGISYPVPSALKSEVRGLEKITSMEYLGAAYVDIPNPSGESIAMFREEFGCVLVEPTFFEIFDYKNSDFEWIAGNADKALVEPFSVVLTETMAKKYFPDGDALGKSIRFEKYYDAKVTGVVSDFPANSDFPFTILISYSSLETIRKGRLENWFSVNDPHQSYVRLAAGVTEEEIEQQIALVHARHTPKELHETRRYLLQPLSAMHYDARFGTYSRRTIDKQTIFTLAAIGLFLLLTASINYVNLSTAHSVLRSKEVGLRKVLGSNRSNLIGQFMTETFVLVSVAGGAALVIAEIMIIKLQSLVYLNVNGLSLSDPVFVISFFSILLFVTLFAGLYPSLVLARFNPVVALKNRFTSELVGNISFRRLLVVAQFTITQILVVGTFIVVNQMQFFRNVNMGFNREAILTFRLPATSPPEMVSVISNKLYSQSFISGFSFSSSLPSGVERHRNFQQVGTMDAASLKDFLTYEYQAIDPSYLDVYGIKLLAGRNLTTADSLGQVLVNRTMAKNLGLGSPQQAVDQMVKMLNGQSLTIAGVIDDFYGNSLKESVDNMIFFINPVAYDYCSIKLNWSSGASTKVALNRFEEIWLDTYPEHLFTYRFFDENIRAFYKQEQRYANLFQVFSAVFLFIGCLGLYGLITFVVTRKSREVAIRKVLGASVSSILVLFSREYVRLIVLSFFLAAPLTYYVAGRWLDNFASHIELEWWYFAMPGFTVLVIALGVVMTRSFATANANPVDKLKGE